MQTELEHELSFLAIESVRETEIRERTKREDEWRLVWLEKKKKERKKETGRVNPTRSFLVKPYPVLRLGRVAPLI